MMKKKMYFALLLSLVLLLTGCALKTVDPVADAKQVILSVNGETVTKSEMNNYVNAYASTLLNNDMNAFYQYYTTGQLPYTSAELLDGTITTLTRSLVQKQKAAEEKYALTDEELSEVKAKAEEQFEEEIQDVIENHLGDSELTDEALREEAIKHAEEEGVTLDAIIDQLTNDKRAEKLRAEAVKDVAVTDEEVKTAFADKLNAQKESFATASNYISALDAGEEIYYIPEGLRYVKHILIAYPDDASDAITEANSELTAARSAYDTAKAAVDEAGENPDEALTKALADAQTALDDAQAKYNAAKDAANALIKEKADEVYALTQAEDADFDALIAEYGEDPGMKTEPAVTEGYLVAEGAPYDEAFLETSLALEKVGDISEPVVSGFGMHIIKFESEVAPYEATEEEFADSIRESLLTDKQDEAYESQLQAWIDAADVKSYPAKMGY